MEWWKYCLLLLIISSCTGDPQPEGRALVPVEDIDWTQNHAPVWVQPYLGKVLDTMVCDQSLIFSPEEVYFSSNLGEYNIAGALNCLLEESIQSLDRVPMDRIERSLFNSLAIDLSEPKFPDPRLFYAFKSQDSLWINQFDAVNVNHVGPDGNWEVQIETDYPYSGTVSFVLTGPSAQEWTVAFRQPGWTDNRPDPLASYKWRTNRKISVELAGEYLYPEVKNGYAYLTRVWNPGEVLEISFPMAVRRLIWTDEIDPQYQRMSLEYGPVVLARKENPEEDRPLPDHGNLLKQKNDAQEDEWVWTIDGQKYVFKRVADFTLKEKTVTSWIIGSIE